MDQTTPPTPKKPRAAYGSRAGAKRPPPTAPENAALPAFDPVPRKHRRDGWTPERQRAFIHALAEWGNVTAAAEAVGMSFEGAYYLRRQPGAESFRAAWEGALAMEGPEPCVPPLTMRGLMHALEAQGRRAGRTAKE